MKKVHLIFDAEIIEGLAESLKEIAVVTGKDFSLDTAAHWALSGQGETPDIIFIDGTVDVSKVDINSGKVTRDKLFISRLKDIRISRPDSQVILLLPEDRTQDLDFLQAITSLAIFDIYFVATFNEENLRHWFESKKSIADVQQMLPGANLEDNDSSFIKSSYGKDQDERTGSSPNLFQKVARIIKPGGEEDAVYYCEETASLNSQFNLLQRVADKVNIPAKVMVKSLIDRATLTSLPKIMKFRRGSSGVAVTLVWSPVPAGKTFLSINLASVAAQLGFTVALIDMDLDCSTWFGLEEEDGLGQVQKGCDNPWVFAHNPEMLENLGVFTTTSKNAGKLNTEFVKRLGADLVIVNSNKLLPASNVIVVADMDMSHVSKISEVLEEMDNFPSEKWLVINRAVKGMSVKLFEEALGMKADAIIPDMTKEVFESIAAGVPASMFCEEIAAPLRFLLGIEGG